MGQNANPARTLVRREAPAPPFGRVRFTLGNSGTDAFRCFWPGKTRVSAMERQADMAWIKTIPYDEATGKLRRLYQRLAGGSGKVDNIMMLHSLRPHSMEGHMALYKNVLHHSGNSHPNWFLEMLGVWVSVLNDCSYCVDHHFAGLKRLMKDDVRADEILDAIRAAALSDEADTLAQIPVRQRDIAALAYARKLTQAPATVTQAEIRALFAAGYDDGDILEINQVVAYFAYANRTVLGLGGTVDGDILGLSPSNAQDETDWSHR